MRYQVQITQSSGERTIQALGEGEITIGSDGSSDLCLRGEAKLLPRHILVAARGERCWVSTAKGAPLWDQEGVAVDGAYVKWGARLSLGSCVFELQAFDSKGPGKSRNNPLGSAADKPGERSKAPSPIVIMLLLCALAYAAIGLLDKPETMASALPSEHPSLFDEGQKCGSNNPVHRAPLAEEEATAKSERAVFAREDGVEAVRLFTEARACYHAAGQAGEAEFVDTRRRGLQEALEEDYTLLRLRLGRALAEGDRSSARKQARQLLTLLHHRKDSSFVLSLRRLELQLSKNELQP